MRIVVVGASVAGISACQALRQAGYEDEIILLSAETAVPYDRPPLSKEILTGRLGAEDILLPLPGSIPADFHPAAAATQLDLDNRRITTEPGDAIAFDGLILATGASARSFPGLSGTQGVTRLRTLEEALNLKRDLGGVADVAVVGAGFIGLEVASSAASLGRRVTVLESAAAPMMRVLPRRVGELFVALHEQNDVDVRCGAGLAEIYSEHGRVTGIGLDDGSSVRADLVVLGLGATPNTGWMEGSGVTVADGVVCDGTLRAAERVYACGDVARWSHPLYGSIRVEHWTTATQHARIAAKNLLADLNGEPSPRIPAADIPYFWSDQHGIKLQLAGWPSATDSLHAAVDDKRFVIVFERDGRVSAALTASWPRLLGRLRQAIAAQVSIEETLDLLPVPPLRPDACLAETLLA